MRFTLLLCTFLFTINTYAADITGPSFDCKKAVTDVEKNICADPELATLDKQVSTAFLELKNHPKDRLNGSVDALIKEQKEWLRNRGGDLLSQYENRRIQLTFPGAPEKLSNAKVKELEAFFSQPGHTGCDLFEILEGSTVIQTAGLDSFACKIYEINPQLGNSLFSSCYGSTKDNFLPHCDHKVEMKKADGLEEYTDYLSTLYGDAPTICQGTMRFGIYNTQSSAILLALNDTTNIAENSAESDTLLHFSKLGMVEKAQFQKYVALKNRAEKGLENYYIHVKKIPADKAKKAAAYHVASIARLYIDSHASSSDGVWGTTQVDNFLKDGTLPTARDDFYSRARMGDRLDAHETEKPELLADLLIIATANDYPKKDIEKIIAAGAKINNTKSIDTALMNAVKRPDILQLLIDKGADINAQNAFGKTALMYAIQYGNLDAVKILVEHHADVNLATFKTDETDCEHNLAASNRTPLMYAAWHANDEVIHYLLAKGAKADVKDSEENDYKHYLTLNDYKRNH